MLNIWNNLDWSILTDALMSAVPVLICITLHECAHGLAALKLGDTTARNMGRLSLNPIKHFDLMGFIMMAFLGFGWAKPVPIDMRRFQNPKRDMAISAAAGPLCNLAITVVCLFLYGALTPLRSGRGSAAALVYCGADGVSQPRLRRIQLHPHPAAGRLQGAFFRDLGAGL